MIKRGKCCQGGLQIQSSMKRHCPFLLGDHFGALPLRLSRSKRLHFCWCPLTPRKQTTPPPPTAELKKHLVEGPKGLSFFCFLLDRSHDPFAPCCRSPPLGFWNTGADSMFSFYAAFLPPLLTSHIVPARIYLALLTLLHKSFLQVKSLKMFPLNSLQTVSKKILTLR